MPQSRENPKAEIPPALARLEKALGVNYVLGQRRQGYGGADAIASVGEHEPHTIEVNDLSRFKNATQQTKAHELIHLWRNQLPGKLIKDAMPDNPENPYDLSNLNNWRKQGKTLATIPQEAAAYLMQKYTADPKSRKALQPWVDDLNVIPLSVEEPTAPDSPALNMNIRPPSPPASEARFMETRVITPKFDPKAPIEPASDPKFDPNLPIETLSLEGSSDVHLPNPGKEGIYGLKDSNGRIYWVPFSQVGKAQEDGGFSFAKPEYEEQYIKDFNQAAKYNEKPGLFESIAKPIGLQDMFHPPGWRTNAAWKQLTEHPLVTAARAIGGPTALMGEGLVRGFGRETSELGKAIDDLGGFEGHDRNPYSAAVHSIQALPFLGPGIEDAQQYMPPTNGFMDSAIKTVTNPQALGTALGTGAAVAPMLMGDRTDAAFDTGLGKAISEGPPRVMSNMAGHILDRTVGARAGDFGFNGKGPSPGQSYLS